MQRVGDILAAMGNGNGQVKPGPGPVDWKLPVKFADECEACPDCGEPWCAECGCHYAECRHPGPMSEREDE